MTDKKFMAQVEFEELDRIYDKLHSMYCQDCLRLCKNFDCPVEKALNAISELSATLEV